jgi:hypothetical protein
MEKMTAQGYLDFSDSMPLSDMKQLSVLRAIAAALIAQVERKPQFVQVGEMAYNLDRFSIVNMNDGLVGLFTPEEETPVVLDEQESAAFRAWWDANADVVKLDVAADTDRAGPDWGECEGE